MSGIEIVGLAFATVGAIDIIVKSCRNLHERMILIKQAENVADTIQLFGVQPAQNTLKARLKLGMVVYRDSRVDQGLKDELDRIFICLQEMLNRADTQLEELRAAAQKKSRYITNDVRDRKQALEHSIRKLKDACDSFQDTIMMVDPKITFSSISFLTKGDFQIVPNAKLPDFKKDVTVAQGTKLVNAVLAKQTGKVKPRSGMFIVEQRPYTRETRDIVEEDVRSLAETLTSALRSQGILDIAGYNESEIENTFNLIFAVPDEAKLSGTLRKILCAPEQNGLPKRPSLNTRVEMCRQLANAILHVRSLDFVHKNINPENIILTRPESAETDNQWSAEHTLFLINWQLVRKSRGVVSVGAGETIWWKKVYQHPSRQVELSQQNYTMGHDIYSLGVCMLEILLWTPTVEINTSGQPGLSQLFLDRAILFNVLDDNEDAANQGRKDDDRACIEEIACWDSETVQKILLSLARMDLPAAAGEKLSRLVASCLTCLEDGFKSSSFNSTISFDPNARAKDGQDFMENVIDTLGNVNV